VLTGIADMLLDIFQRPGREHGHTFFTRVSPKFISLPNNVSTSECIKVGMEANYVVCSSAVGTWIFFCLEINLLRFSPLLLLVPASAQAVPSASSLLAGPSASSTSEPSANPLLLEPFDNITNSTMHVSRDQINSNKTKAAILFVLFFFL